MGICEKCSNRRELYSLFCGICDHMICAQCYELETGVYPDECEKTFKLEYGNNISEEINANDEDEALDNSSHPESNVTRSYIYKVDGELI